MNVTITGLLLVSFSFSFFNRKLNYNNFHSNQEYLYCIWHITCLSTNYFTAQTSKNLVLTLPWFVTLKLEQWKHSVKSCHRNVYRVLLYYLEQIRSYGPEKQRPCFNFDIDLWPKEDQRPKEIGYNAHKHSRNY